MSVRQWNAVSQFLLGTVRCTLQECTPFMSPSSFTNRCKMSAQAVLEGTGKDLINRKLPPGTSAVKCRYVMITEQTDWTEVVNKNPWLETEKLVVKPDQLIKRRGKLGLMKMETDLDTVKKWVAERMNKDQQVEQTTGKLKRFIIEPFVPHKQEEETYVCIYSHRKADTILFHHEGGVNVGDVDKKALKLEVPVGEEGPAKSALIEKLLVNMAGDKKETIAKFVGSLYQLYVNLYFTYLEINPLVVKDDGIYLLDLAAKLDSTADFICKQDWGEIEFPPPFGRDAYPEEAYIAELDAKTGASLKLTILNPAGRIWTMVAGGGASVIYSDTICDLGAASELANYGEYSGNPSEQQTYDYAKTILSLMTKEKHKDGKILLIGGGIANFTNVAATFKGIVKALQEFQPKLVEFNIQIFVRRGGPNYQEGLRVMREVGKSLGIPLHVFGPETHMTAICSMALGKQPIPEPEAQKFSTAICLEPSRVDVGSATSPKSDLSSCSCSPIEKTALKTCDSVDGSAKKQLFSNKTRAIIWGMQIKAVQSMLDFDFICRRSEPSVAAIVYPFTADHKRKFLWGTKEILIPAYKQTKDAMTKHPDVDVVVTFASLRSAYDSAIEAMQYPQIRTIAIIAEGIPENMTRKLILMADQKGVTIIGPATVGGVKPGCFKIGNSGGMMDNILESKLYRPGSVAYVSRSGGMSNELNNIVSQTSDGVLKGIAIGGDRYPGSTFISHIMRCEHNPDVKMLVLLGEVGGREEYEVCEALKSKKITKPLTAWCIGTCATMFHSEVQFGHAGAVAHSTLETAAAKNAALKAAGASVPDSFDSLGELMKTNYEKLLKEGTIVPKPEVSPPHVPMDYSWARELGLIRKPSSFITTISDERGNELVYAGMPVSEVLEQKLGIGGVVSLLWFKQLLPPIYCDFFEMCLMLTADHGPAVSGALNTIVCARAGKDLVSSLVSGLLTIGERFGGAIDGAARMFSEAYDAGLQPQEFVDDTRKKEKLILGIGHRVKSVNNPDVRVKLIKEYAMENFPACPLIEYALEVEKVTTGKKANLILNVDGVVGVAFVDMLRNSGCFTKEEAQEYIEIGAINSFFVLGRSIGFIGHFMDQKRLKQALYRHPWDDIAYMLPEESN